MATKGKWFERYIQNKFLRPIRIRAILKILNKLPSGNILDIGCMDDYILKRLPKRFDYYGIDDDPLCNHQKISKMKAAQLPKNRKYDIVLCTEVLEHLDDPVKGIKIIKTLSKRFVLISVPNEPFFAFFRFFTSAKEHLWTIFPWTFERYFGKPIYEKLACFRRTYIALWDLKRTL